MLFLSTLLKAAGTGIGFLSGMRSANQYESTANLNASIAEDNARTAYASNLAALGLEGLRNRAEMTNARTNLRLALNDVEARKRNAERLRLFAEAKSKAGREALRRQSKAFERFEAGQRSGYAGAGVALSGSALDVLAETAGQMRIALADMHDEANLERADTLNRSLLERVGASQDRTAALSNFHSSSRGVRINSAAIQIGRISAQSALRSALFGADISRLSGQDAAAGQRLNSFGGLLTGIAGGLSSLSNANNLGMR